MGQKSGYLISPKIAQALKDLKPQLQIIKLEQFLRMARRAGLEVKPKTPRPGYWRVKSPADFYATTVSRNGVYVYWEAAPVYGSTVVFHPEIRVERYPREGYRDSDVRHTPNFYEEAVKAYFQAARISPQQFELSEVVKVIPLPEWVQRDLDRAGYIFFESEVASFSERMSTEDQVA